MGIFDRFPYSSTHEMNLDFMLGKATEIAEDMQTVTTGMAQVQAGLSAISEKTEQATQAAAAAAQSASSIEGSVTAAEEAAEEAQMHNESAQTWANNALTYKADCQRAATEAAASSSSAAQAATAAAASEDTVATYAQAANASAQSAANNNDSAHQYANQASASASNATFHSSNAQTAATNANTSATNAQTAATNAQTAATRASALKDDCQTLHSMCTTAVDLAGEQAAAAANSAAQAAATKTDVENLVESLPEDFTDLNNTVNQLSDEIDGVKSTIRQVSVKSRNLLPIQPEYGSDTTIDLGADITFPNGAGIGFDAIDLVTSAASAGFIDFRTEADTRAALITLNSFRNNETGIMFPNESSPHNGRYNNESVAAFRGSLTFRYIIIHYKTPLVSSGVAKNFSITDGCSPTPYIPHDTAKDYAIEQDANPFDLYAEVNKTSIMDEDYWDIKTDVYTNPFGAINSSTGIFTTRLFPAKVGDTLRYKFSVNNTFPILLIYDENMQVIPSETVLGTGQNSYISGEHTFAEGESFFRLNGVVNLISNYSLSYNDVPVVIKDYVKSYVEGYAVGQRTFPAYWDTAVENAVTEIKNKLLLMETGDCFFFVTDQHWTSNAQHSSAIIDYISEKTGIYNVFIGGDIVSSNNASQVGAMTEMLNYLGTFKGKNVRLFSTIGNHDRNSVAQSDQTLWLSLAQQYNALIKPEEEWLNTNGTPLCNVYDNKSQKIRYIQFWYTADSVYSEDVASALVSAMTSAPNDYTIVLMSHAYWNGTDPAQGAVTFANLILDTMDTMNANVALWVCGHAHADKTVVLTSTGGKTLRIMSTTTDSVGQHPSDPSMTAGTTTEQAFDVYCINTTAKTINAIRVGAGSSRNFTY